MKFEIGRRYSIFGKVTLDTKLLVLRYRLLNKNDDPVKNYIFHRQQSALIFAPYNVRPQFGGAGDYVNCNGTYGG